MSHFFRKASRLFLVAIISVLASLRASADDVAEVDASHACDANLITSSAVARAAHEEMVLCQGLDGDVVFEILMDKSSTKPRALSMRVSDPNVLPERQEIAFFDAQDHQLISEYDEVVRIVGLVDLKNPLTGRKGERVGGTVLGALASMTVELEIDFEEVSTSRKRHAGLATYLKKNGEDLVQDLDCRRQK